MIGMTLTEKILARHAGKGHVSPGDNIWVDVDVLMTHDVCGPGAIEIFKREFGAHAKVWDRDKVVIIGAGPIGLALLLYLRPLFKTVQVVEMLDCKYDFRNVKAGQAFWEPPLACSLHVKEKLASHNIVHYKVEAVSCLK